MSMLMLPLSLSLLLLLLLLFPSRSLPTSPSHHALFLCCNEALFSPLSPTESSAAPLVGLVEGVGRRVESHERIRSASFCALLLVLALRCFVRMTSSATPIRRFSCASLRGTVPGSGVWGRNRDSAGKGEVGLFSRSKCQIIYERGNAKVDRVSVTSACFCERCGTNFLAQAVSANVQNAAKLMRKFPLR